MIMHKAHFGALLLLALTQAVAPRPAFADADIFYSPFERDVLIEPLTGLRVNGTLTQSEDATEAVFCGDNETGTEQDIEKCAYWFRDSNIYIDFVVEENVEQMATEQYFEILEQEYQSIGVVPERVNYLGKEHLMIHRHNGQVTWFKSHFISGEARVVLEILKKGGEANETVKNFIATILLWETRDDIQTEIRVRDVESFNVGAGTVEATIAGANYEDVREVTLGPNNALALNSMRPIRRDVDGDGQIDVTFLFRIAETGLTPSDTEACLTMQLVDQTLASCAPITYQ